MARRPLLIPVLVLALISGRTALADEGWVPLFDGKTLDGWKVNGGTASYKVEDGAIVGTTVEGSPNTFLCKGDFKDFVLELEVKCDPALNSGVQVRSHVYEKDDPDPKNSKRAGVVYGPQCEIARKETGTAARFYDEGRRGQWLAEIKPEAKDAFRDDGWNRYRIVVQGNRYRSWINGVAASDFTDDVDRSGFIGLQVHGIARGTGPYQVRWRNVRVKELKPGEEVALGEDRNPSKRSVLIVDGMNNHDWERATRILKSILEESGLFSVDVSTSPPAPAPAEKWQAWKPDFARYDVVVMNFNGGHTSKGLHWPKDLEKALEDYVSGGGGLVSYHAANNSFPDWPAYNRMIGLGWRDKGFGPSLVVGGDGKVVEVPQGQGLDPGHGPEHDFVVTTLDADHPITRGMSQTWMHPHEQLTHGQHGPAKDMTVLTYAFSKDTKQNEVMDWVVPYGQGRVYTTMLGHLWRNGPDTAMRCVGFQTMLIRGVEWAASGKVSYPVPEDFPTTSEIRLRSDQEKTTSTNPPEGFRAVFNGRDLAGWEGSPAYWSVEDGCLTGKADGTLKYNRFITWRGGTVRNFELRVKVWVSPTGNSGLQYRGTERPDLGESVVTGYQCDVVANRPDYNGMLYEERGRRILAHTGEKVVIDPQGQPWVVGRFPLKEFKPGEWHDYRVLAEGNHQRHWIDGHPTADVIDLDEKGRKLDGVLAVQVHVGPPMTIRYKDFFLKALPDDLPLIKPEQATIPPDAPKVAPQGQDKPRKPDAE